MGERFPSAADVPARIGRHSVLGYLATGGMSEIFLGRDHPSGRPVVIKRILPHLARQGSFVAMFLDEARIGSLVHHPNVVEVHELGQVGTELFMVMEYLAGENASGLLRRLVGRNERLAYGLAAHIVAEACKGLHAAHELTDEKGHRIELVHRDVSPQNIFLTYDGAVKVLDFGIATAAHRLSRTATGELKGKFSYMSPEQCRGEALDLRSDVFSLGIVLYELSMQKRLFSRPNELLVLKAVCEDPITRPSREHADYPEILEDICMKALSRDKDKRYQTAKAMQDDLEAAVQLLLGRTDARMELAYHLERLFADRIEEKRKMLHDVRSGTEMPSLPSVEVDESVVVPQVSQYTKTPVSGIAPMPPPAPRTSRGIAAALALLAVLAIAAVVAIPRVIGDDATATPPAPPPPPIETAAVTPEPAPAPSPPPSGDPAPPTAPSEVVIRIESRPKGATVFVDGEDKGKAPVDLRLPVRDDTARLQLKSRGYGTLSQDLRLDRDQTLLLTLSKKKGGADKADKAEPKPERGKSFHRFN
jgi:eukaryotic-like serine/threonine-protein kinase